MKKREIRIWAVLAWLIIWQIAAMVLDQEIFLVSPWRAFLRFLQLAGTTAFWLAALGSTLRIAAGFLLAFVCGAGCAYLAARFRRVRELMTPLVAVIKAVPVASFVILALICFSSRYLAVLISFLIVFPLIYASTLAGIGNVDARMLEMGKVFRLDRPTLFRYIYLPALSAFLTPALRTAIGMAWKAGTAAEVIGTPRGSIGAKLQQAKVYLETPDLIAWTLAIILLSIFTEKLVMFLLTRVEKLWQTAPAAGAAGTEGAGTGGAPGRNSAEGLISTGGEIGRNSAEGAPVTGASVALQGIGKSFDGKDVLRDFNLTAAPGETIAVMAPSGAGKTTLIRLIAGLEKSDAGSVRVRKERSDRQEKADEAGKSPARITGGEPESPARIAGGEPESPARIAMVFQEDRLCEDLDATGNIRLANRALSDKEIAVAAAEIGLTD
nr:ATP-binding cassette domain-containing protein [Clostridia bacterium]